MWMDDAVSAGVGGERGLGVKVDVAFFVGLDGGGEGVAVAVKDDEGGVGGEAEDAGEVVGFFRGEGGVGCGGQVGWVGGWAVAGFGRFLSGGD